MPTKRPAQYNYSKDTSAFLLCVDIASPPKILESSTRTGALSPALPQALAGTGKLTIYAPRPDFTDLPKKIIAEFLV